MSARKIIFEALRCFFFFFFSIGEFFWQTSAATLKSRGDEAVGAAINTQRPPHLASLKTSASLDV